MSAFYRRIEPLDVLTDDDGEALLLLPPDRVVRLSPIAAAVFAATAHPTRLDGLVTVVEAHFGPPTDDTTAAALGQLLDDLVAANVLERLNA